MQTTVTASAGDKATFYWKVSSEAGGDSLRFYIDDQLQTSIGGEVDWQKKSYALSAGSRTLKWVYIKDSSEEAGEDCGWVDGLTVGTSSLTAPPNEYGEALDCDLKFTTTGTDGGTWSKDNGPDSEYYYEADAMKSYDTLSSGHESCLQTIVESDSTETVKFYWKISGEEDDDYLEFYIDDSLQDSITGEVDWQQKSYPVSTGIHILKWRYIEGGTGQNGNCGWVDFVQWTGPSPAQDPDNWQEITYKHDVLGRRIDKKLVVSSSNPVEGYSTRYVHDGDHVIAEYDGNNNLLRKYVYGPCIDEPICMIEVADSNATYYYHFDALGSVVALSDSSGDTVQTYEYSVYGEVAVEDANHPNPYMFAGRRYDIEIGLYYNRARYYNPYTGRFLQTDPIGYSDGINWYAYCGNNPIGCVDPSGRVYRFLDMDYEGAKYHDKLIWAWIADDGSITIIDYYDNIDDWCDASDKKRFKYGINDQRSVGKKLSECWQEATIDGKKYDKAWFYERLQFLEYLGCGNVISTTEKYMEENHLTVNIICNAKWSEKYDGYNYASTKPGATYVNVNWNPTWDGTNPPPKKKKYPTPFPPLVGLVHELSHAADFVYHNPGTPSANREGYAVGAENQARLFFKNKVPGWTTLLLR